MSNARSKAISRFRCFSRQPLIPIAPLSSPPCPASMMTVGYPSYFGGSGSCGGDFCGDTEQEQSKMEKSEMAAINLIKFFFIITPK